MNPRLFLMQNGAPKNIIQKNLKRNVRVIQWPAFNFDLNPNETVWNEMKNWIQNNYGEKFNYDQFRSVAKCGLGTNIK